MEEWRDVPSKPGLQASSLGRVRRKYRVASLPNGGKRDYKPIGTFGVKRRAKKTAKHSYRGVTYRDIGNIKVHRAVCEAFHGPQPFPEAKVLHRDEDSHNNLPGNVYWGTQKENLNAPGFIAYCHSRTGENSPTAKARKRQSV